MTTPARSRYAGHRFPAEIISHAVWLYFRFPLSLRTVEEMLAARQLPPMMLSLAWLESTTLAKEIAAAAAFNAGAVQADDAWARFQAAGDPNELSG